MPSSWVGLLFRRTTSLAGFGHPHGVGLNSRVYDNALLFFLSLVGLASLHLNVAVKLLNGRSMKRLDRLKSRIAGKSWTTE